MKSTASKIIFYHKQPASSAFHFYYLYTMGKPWVGYLAAGLFVIAGAFEFIGEKPVMGTLFLLVGIANIFIQIKLNKLKKGGK